MPILYPIGSLALFVLYYVERFTIAKFYRQPPIYGLNISMSSIKVMTDCSIILNFTFGFWLYSNKQIYSNKIIPLNFRMDTQEHGHTIIDSIKTINPGTPFLIFLVIHLLT